MKDQLEGLSLKLKAKVYIAIMELWRKIAPKFVGLLKPTEFYEEKVPERIVEYPFIIKNIDHSKKNKILDVGCKESYLITELAALGHEVYGIDIRAYPVKYPGVKIILGDIRKAPFPNECFDVVIAVSTIEHIGIKLREYCINEDDPEGDKKAIKEIVRVLKPTGKILITLPYGRRGRLIQSRVYNKHSLKELLAEAQIKIDDAEFFATKDRSWVLVHSVEAEETESSTFIAAVVLLRLSKKFN